MNTRDNILEVATRLFGKHGFSGVSVRDIAKEADVNVAAINTLLLFVDNRMKCLNTFRIFISDDLELSDEFFEKTAPSGPPGSEVFLKVLTREVGKSIPLKKREWAVRAIFDYVCHTGIIVSTMALKERTDHYPWMKKKAIKQDTFDMVDSITQFLVKS